MVLPVCMLPPACSSFITCKPECILKVVTGSRSGHSGRAVEGWDRDFESHSGHGCLYCVRLFCVCVGICVGRGLATD
jgi:hypothetical protein